MKMFGVSHSTRYEYESPVVHAHHIAHLAPRPLQFQRVSGTTALVGSKSNQPKPGM